jgi:hypothetical protein
MQNIKHKNQVLDLENEQNTKLLEASQEDQDLNVLFFLACTRLNQEKAPKFVGDPEQKEECKEYSQMARAPQRFSQPQFLGFDTDTIALEAEIPCTAMSSNDISGNKTNQPMLTGQRPIYTDKTVILIGPSITKSEEQLKITKSLVRDIQNNKNKEEDNQIVSGPRHAKPTNTNTLSKKITPEELNKMKDSLGVKDDSEAPQKTWTNHTKTKAPDADYEDWLKQESKKANLGMFWKT